MKKLIPMPELPVNDLSQLLDLCKRGIASSPQLGMSVDEILLHSLLGY